MFLANVYNALPSFADAFTSSMFRRGFAVRKDSSIRTPKGNRATFYTTLSVVDYDDILAEFRLAFVRIRRILASKRPIKYRGRIEADGRKTILSIRPDALPTDILVWRRCLGYYVGKRIHRALAKIRPHVRTIVAFDGWKDDREFRNNAFVVAKFAKAGDIPTLKGSDARRYFIVSEPMPMDSEHTPVYTIREKPLDRHVILPAMPDSDDMNPWRGIESRSESDPRILAETREYLHTVRGIIGDEHMFGALNAGSVAKYVRAVDRWSERSSIRGERLTASAIRNKFERARIRYNRASAFLKELRATIHNAMNNASGHIMLHDPNAWYTNWLTYHTFGGEDMGGMIDSSARTFQGFGNFASDKPDKDSCEYILQKPDRIVPMPPDHSHLPIPPKRTIGIRPPTIHNMPILPIVRPIPSRIMAKAMPAKYGRTVGPRTERKVKRAAV